MLRLNRANLGSSLRERDVDGIRISIAAYAQDSTLPMHEHGDPYLCLVAAGAYRQRSGGREAECTRGSLLVHPQGHRHANCFSPHGARCLNLFLSTSLCSEESVNRLFADHRLLHLPDSGNLLVRIERELTTSDAAAELALQAAVLDLVAQTCRLDEHALPRWMAQVMARLHDDPLMSPSLGELAKLADVHPAHLARTFRRVHGVSVGEYLRNLRVGLARQALRDRQLSIADIATQAGFTDQSHFAKVFRRQTGQTPSDFRRSMQTTSR
jgi:AraC family transcriptional regulator